MGVDTSTVGKRRGFLMPGKKSTNPNEWMCIRNRKCRGCKKTLNVNEFYIHTKTYKGRKTKNFRLDCKSCRKSQYEDNIESIRLYYQNNKDAHIKRTMERYHRNPQAFIDYTREYKKKNPEKVAEDRRNYKRRRKLDPVRKMQDRVSNAVREGLKKRGGGKRGSSTWSKLPYTPDELCLHLESQFEDWMTWDNYGAWHPTEKRWNIDHIIPQSKLLYDSMDHPNFQKCWALENLQPLEVSENMSKGNKLLDE